ncbi:protein of unknown function DUF294 nucleotidyltransferase putative [Paenibacillus curdlanolyticus YK9]|uniref:CBS domain-containing protein n=1 Tax=Paenibacillus curdlanolyticus YK9 TaxID=717606 RepID=E0I303_9BACL|nr:DUF294 nucleotidyltransferase-like domain-containing protein [Paenibacillus curdlanolyticus]EFM12667.1 protein of unknown function DUF294 nucleotidyltransferase putative [Paenibacillus curdlanolyticus YK9]
MSDPEAVQLLKSIGSAVDESALRSLRDHVNDRMEAIRSDLPVEQFYNELNEAYDAIIKRAISLAEAHLARMGMGSPPVPYAYLLFGSGGRQEQTLSSDQDSGLVYADIESLEQAEAGRRYFTELSKQIVIQLELLGFPRCEGNVLSDNPSWGMPLSQWREQINGWFEEPAWEAVRYLLIVADGRCVYGEYALSEQLKDIFFNDVRNHPIITTRMLENTMRHKVLLGVFGQLLKEQYGEDAGSLDLKYGAYIPMVNAVRLMAILQGVRETKTIGRIQALLAAGVISSEEAESITNAFRLFLRLRLMTTEKHENGLYTNNGMLAVGKLSKEWIEELKSGLKVGKKLQRRVFKHTSGKFR